MGYKVVGAKNHGREGTKNDAENSWSHRGKRSSTCPVCGKESPTRYWNERKGLFIYKHTMLKPGKRGGSISETIYHEVP